MCDKIFCSCTGYRGLEITEVKQDEITFDHQLERQEKLRKQGKLEQVSEHKNTMQFGSGRNSTTTPMTQNIPKIELDESQITDDTVKSLLREWKLSEYCGMFDDNGIDTLEDLQHVTHEDLKEMGMKKLGHRKRLLRRIKAYFTKNKN